MGSIYKNAFLTLGATASSDGAGGLFVERDGDIMDIPLPGCALLKNVSLKARRTVLHPSFLPPPHGDPLCHRAWAWQERLLSRRILHFGSQELIAECRTGVGCECGMPGMIDDTKSDFEIVVAHVGWNKQLWRGLLESYTQLELTYDRDRLPALSGIASQVFSKSEYLAGMSREFLLGDLCWVTGQCYNETRLVSRIPGAPSWSWASVNAPVSWTRIMGSTTPDNLKVVEASCVAEGENHYGRVSVGYLILSGVVIETSVSPLAESRDSYEFQWCYDDHIGIQTGGEFLKGFFFRDCTIFDDICLSTQPVSLLILSYEEASLDVFALVLRKLEDEDVVYQRIGAAKFENVPENYVESVEPRVVKIV